MLKPIMMIFSEEDANHRPHTGRRKPKKALLFVAFLVILGGTWWVLQPKGKSPAPAAPTNATSDASSNTITGTITGSDGKLLTSVSILVSDSQGREVNSLSADQNGNYQLFLPNGTYIFSINAKDQQLIQQVVVSPTTSKVVDIQLDVPGDI